MPGSSPASPAPRESDQLPEEQPGAEHSGTSTPDERKRKVGLDPRPDPESRPNTGNPHDHD